MKQLRIVLARCRYGAAVALLIVSMLAPVPKPAEAASVCAAVITPGTVSPGGIVNFNIRITNDSSGGFRWIDVTVPPNNFAYTGNSVNGWFSFDHTGGATFFNGNISPGGSANFGVSAQVGPGTSPGETWTVRVADNVFGNNPIDCEGSMTTVIEGHPPNNTGSGISNLAVSNITASSATVTWTSNNPSSSVVYYGTTSDYGQSTSPNLNQETSHSVNITGLSADTTYHFQAAGFEGNGTFVYSPDGTFVTLPAPSNPGGSGGGGPSGSPSSSGSGSSTPRAVTVTPSGTIVINPGATTDQVAPGLAIETKLTGAYKTAPTVKGVATDNVGVAIVEYSLDGGKNWLPAEVMEGRHTKQLTFTLQMPPLQDGNYDLVLRAVDESGNSITSSAQTLVIDQLPPLVGGSVVAVGPQIVYPDDKGTLTALAGADQKVTLSAVGGPITITLDAMPADKQQSSNLFSLRKSPDSGLWTGVMSFQRAGDYTVTVRALDGAGNVTNRNLFNMRVLPRAPVMEQGTNTVIKSKVTVFYRDPETASWIPWDAAPYAQVNPQTTNAGRNYGFYLPPGTYYLRYDAPGYKTVITRNITINKPTALTQDMYLARAPGLHVGGLHIGLPWTSLAPAEYSQSVTSKVRSRAPAVPVLPKFKLPQTNQRALSYNELWGRLTVISLVNSWAPSSQDQLAILAKFKNEQVRLVTATSGDSQSRATVYARLSGYPAPLLVDSTNQLAQGLQVSTVPSHYFLDKHGVVKKVMFGVLSKEELLQNAQN